MTMLYVAIIYFILPIFFAYHSLGDDSVSNSLPKREDLSPFTAKVYDLVKSADIFNELYDVSISPDEAEEAYMNGALSLAERFHIPAFNSLYKMVSAAARDAFASGITSLDVFKAFTNTVEGLLRKKRLLNEKNMEYHATSYFKKLNNLYEATRPIMKSPLSSLYTVVTASNDFVESLSDISLDDVLFIMTNFSDELRKSNQI